MANNKKTAKRYIITKTPIKNGWVVQDRVHYVSVSPVFQTEFEAILWYVNSTNYSIVDLHTGV